MNFTYVGKCIITTDVSMNMQEQHALFNMELQDLSLKFI